MIPDGPRKGDVLRPRTRAEYDRDSRCPQRCASWEACLYEEHLSPEAFGALSRYQLCCRGGERVDWPAAGGPDDQLAQDCWLFPVLDRVLGGAGLEILEDR